MLGAPGLEVSPWWGPQVLHTIYSVSVGSWQMLPEKPEPEPELGQEKTMRVLEVWRWPFVFGVQHLLGSILMSVRSPGLYRD